MNASPVYVDLVLLGGGHAHVEVIRRFAMQPLSGVRLTVISREIQTPYSGMLPGLIAGWYRRDEVHIDLPRLARFAGARFLRDEVVGLDRANHRVLCRDRPPLAYDRVSINIGSTPQTDPVPGATEHTVPVKPIGRFDARWQALLERVRTREGHWRVAVVGGGAGGVELLLAMQHRLGAELRGLGRDPGALTFHLVTGRGGLMPTHNRWVRECFARLLRERGVVVHERAEVRAVRAGVLCLADGSELPADEIMWVTRAGGAPWLRGTGLALDEDGCLRDRAHPAVDHRPRGVCRGRHRGDRGPPAREGRGLRGAPGQASGSQSAPLACRRAAAALSPAAPLAGADRHR